MSESPYYWAPQQGRTEFRVKRAGTDLGDAAVVARFSASQVQSVIPHGDKLVVFRVEQDTTSSTNPTTTTHVLVFDLADPTAPTVGSTSTVGYLYPYYLYFCGVDGGYWFNYGQGNWTSTSDSIVFLGSNYDYTTNTYTTSLTSIGLGDPAHPTVSETPLPARNNSYYLGLVPDGADPGVSS